MFGTQANTIRQTCRACHNICFTPEGSPAIGPEGYRCEGCETAGYERYDFDKSLPRPEGATEPTPPPEPVQPTEPPDDASEARPSDEPKSADEAQGEQVEVSSAPPEAE
jgi:hypothetical protein